MEHDSPQNNHVLEKPSEDACCADTPRSEPKKKTGAETNYWKIAAMVFMGLFFFNAFFRVSVAPRQGVRPATPTKTSASSAPAVDLDATLAAEKEVLPPDGVEIPLIWGDLGSRMVEAGVIDRQKFEAIYTGSGGLSEGEKALLYGADNGRLRMDAENSRFLLNLLWAFGLGNKSDVLDSGPMQDPRYGGAERFASTGGWTLANGQAMDHYSKHAFVTLTQEQADRVRAVAENIYRPCCGNNTLFPDCNHGMAMLGLLELMAAQGATEDDMYKAALAVNAYWFPDTYLTVAKYMRDTQGTSWSKVSPKEILGAAYSSSSGYQRLRQQSAPVQSSGGGGGGCGV
ncbi:hypothetical protein HYW18_02530 [Candidatus Uhrbacteria bacterium]|nr:hypothetical protein [Candidatus Uhrbacteria bacterium]